jgi:hypothetical protein
MQATYENYTVSKKINNFGVLRHRSDNKYLRRYSEDDALTLT